MKKTTHVETTTLTRRNSNTGSAWGRRVRSVTGSSGLIVARRARRDLSLLATVIALTATATVLAVTGPGLVLQTVDGGVRETLEQAGSSADITLNGSIKTPRENQALLTSFLSADDVISLDAELPDRLPETLSRVVGDISLGVLSGEGSVAPRATVPDSSNTQYLVRTGLLTPSNMPRLVVSEGRLPEARVEGEAGPVEVVISTAAADAASLALGDVIQLEQLGYDDESNASSVRKLELEVVGIVAPIDAVDNAWSDLPELWEPLTRDAVGASAAVVRVSVLTDASGLDAVSDADVDAIDVRFRLHVDPSQFTTVRANAAIDEIAELDVKDTALTGGNQVLDARTELPKVLSAFPQQSKAALAQMSIMMSGVIGIAGIVVILLSRLLVYHRADAVALERARGASVLSVGMRTLAESTVTTIIGVGLGIVISVLVLSDAVRDPLPIVVVALVAALAGPIQAMSLARNAWNGKRDPANRQDRKKITLQRRARRLVSEAAIVVIAIAALYSIRDRGLIQTRTDGVDPFLASAPLLIAAAVTVVIVRIVPFPIRAIGAAARQSRGPLGILGAVRAQQSLAVLPLLALTLGTALAVSGGLLVATVREGQNEASWERIGADLRIEGEIEVGLAESLRAANGVDAVGSLVSRGGVGFDLGTTSRQVTVRAIDAGFVDVVELTPSLGSVESLRSLNTPVDEVSGEDRRIPVIIDETLNNTLVSTRTGMYYGRDYVPIVVVGTTNIAPTGYDNGPFVYIDLDALNTVLRDPLPADTLLVIGDNALAAATELGVPRNSIQERTQWIEDRRSLALIAGVERTMLFAVAAVAVLAAVALIATVVSGARARGRTLSLLRTLGMSPRLGWWLALAELAPLVIASIFGGILAGVSVVLALAPSIGIDVLAGGTTIPAASLSPIVPAGIAVGAIALLFVGVLADVLVHRRDKLSEVLRVGETV